MSAKYEPREFAISGTIHGPAFIGAEELVEFINRGLAQATSGATVDLEAADFAAEPEDTDDACPCSKGSNYDADDSERYYLTCAGISGLPCKAHGADCRGRRGEDTDDVEPEPLKAGEFVFIWAQMEATTEPDRLWVTVPGTERFNPTANVPVSPDAIVRPSAGQVPPWVKPAPLTIDPSDEDGQVAELAHAIADHCGVSVTFADLAKALAERSAAEGGAS